jgi:hypothetical protein
MTIRDSFEQRLSEAVEACRGCVHVYYTPDKDAYFAPWALAGARVIMTELGNPRKLRDKGLLVSFLQAHLSHTSAKPCPFVWSSS